MKQQKVLDRQLIPLLEKLEQDGWPSAIIQVYAQTSMKKYRKLSQIDRQKAYQEDLQTIARFGSPAFQRLWYLAHSKTGKEVRQTAFQLALDYVGMPDELSTDWQELRDMLARFAADLAPHDRFWHDFCQHLQAAFTQQDFTDKSEKAELKQRLHQFRYVISSQQTQWVRQHYQTGGRTDAQALALYLADLPAFSYQVYASARLHNKAYLDLQTRPPRVTYPNDDPQQVNFKILLGFHSEFILDRKGKFLTILQLETADENGLVNGASFNYGNADSRRNGKSHTRYDVSSPKVWDPAFRRKCLRQQGRRFVSPKKDKSPEGYLSHDGYYARNGKSAKANVREAARTFKESLVRPPVSQRLKIYWNYWLERWRRDR